MTNGEKFKSTEERYVEFKEFCHKYNCDNCPVNEDGFMEFMEVKCGFRWLDLEYKKELKNCPFCGGKARIGFSGSSGETLYYVECKKCFGRTVPTSNKDRAFEEWNRRV